MSTISNSLASSLVTTSGSNSSSSSTFMGASTYSRDFQNVIDRAAAIASLPINLLTNQQTTLNEQATDLKSLDTQLGKLQAAIQGIGNALGSSAFQTQISDTKSVSATIGDGAAEGVYTINVSSIGAYSKSLSATNWNAVPDPSGNPSSYTLIVGGKAYNFTATDNSAASVSRAINSRYSNLVQALAVNVGSTDVPDWRISLQSTRLGSISMDILGQPAGLQEQQAPVNGFSNSQTSAAWNPSLDPSANPATYNLIIGSESYGLTAIDNNIQSVVDAINNSTYGSQVQATVVNVAKSGDPADNRIQLTSTTTEAVTLDLQRQAPSLQQQMTPVNGLAVSQTATSWDSTPDASGNPTSYYLYLDGKALGITPSDNNAQTLVDSINSQYGSQVTAQVVNGPGGDSDKRIQLTSTQSGTVNLDLRKAVSLEHTQVSGSLATYEVVGSGKTVSSNTRSVTIASGVTLSLLAKSDAAVDVTVSRSSSELDTALATFTATYNTTADLVASHHGQSAGSLQGQSVLAALTRALSSLSTFGSSDGAISNLEGLGLKLGTDGHFTYNSFGLMAANFTNSTGVSVFLGSATTGGFLKSATDALKGLEDPITGLLKVMETDLQSHITALGTKIADRTDKVNQLKLNMQRQMAAADALIASMQQQANYLSSMFAAQQTADKMYN